MAVALPVRPGPAALHPPPHLTDPARRPSWRRRVRSARAERQPARTPSQRLGRAQPGLVGASPPFPAPVSAQFRPEPASDTHEITAHNQFIGGIRLNMGKRSYFNLERLGVIVKA